jgi:hypothetical protein
VGWAGRLGNGSNGSGRMKAPGAFWESSAGRRMNGRALGSRARACWTEGSARKAQTSRVESQG